MDRRTFLALGASGLLVAGCTGSGGGLLPGPGPSAAPEVDPDAAVRAGVADSERALVAAYRAAIAGLPELASAFGVILAQHEEHLARVLGGSTPSGDATSRGAEPGAEPGAPPSSPSPASPSPALPSTAPEALADLARRERAAERQRTRACDDAASSALARDLCLIAASEAQHAVTLAALAERGD